MQSTGSVCLVSPYAGYPRRGGAAFLECVASPACCSLAVCGRDVRVMASKKARWPSRPAKEESAGQRAKRAAEQQRRDRVNPDGLQELAQA
jgi:hypothetical protein